MVEALSPSKVILLAINLVIETNSTTQLRQLASQYPTVLHTDLILRIILTYLPETVDISDYSPLLKELATGEPIKADSIYIDDDSVKDLADKDAIDAIRKVQLVPLLWSDAPADLSKDSIVRFVIHRTYKIDQETGLSVELPELIVPFLDRSPYLREWFITTLVPLLRINYEYYPELEIHETITAFEKLNGRQGVDFLLTRGKKSSESSNQSMQDIARNLRGLVGPWMYGGNAQKRRKLTMPDTQESQSATISYDLASLDNRDSAWDHVFDWILESASTSWESCVEAVVGWNGPADIDLGTCTDGQEQLEGEEQQQLRLRYARTAFAAAYSIPVPSSAALNGVHRILSKLTILLDLPDLPTFEADMSSLPSINTDETKYSLADSTKYLVGNMLDDDNIVTTPNAEALNLCHGVLLSAQILARFGVSCTMRKAGQLALLHHRADQHAIFASIITKMSSGPRGDDQYWTRCRKELLWLYDWGSVEIDDGEGVYGRGILGVVGRDTIEIEVLKMLLANTRYSLARTVYEDTDDPRLSKQQLQNTIVDSALQAYDISSNANKTRGGVKKCAEILSALPETMEENAATRRIKALIDVTHSIGKFRLVLKQGEPFLPIDIRTQQDPIVLLEKILDQNSGSYTQMQEFVDIAEAMVDAGLTSHDVAARLKRDDSLKEEQKSLVARRVRALCINAALAEDDFETAYSFTMTRLEVTDVATAVKTSSNATTPATDDYSWRAALQTGKYRMNSRTTKPTHVGNASGNLEVRHLEQRLECISLALRIAPRSTLQEILNVARRCEEELEVKLKEDAEAESAWDRQADQTAMPGGFGDDLKPATLSRHAIDRAPINDGPISIFDLTKASAAKAQKTLSAISGLKVGSERSQQLSSLPVTDEPARRSGEYVGGVFKPGARKRDQLREAAVGTLASGVGWLIGASSTPRPQSPASEH